MGGVGTAALLGRLDRALRRAALGVLLGVVVLVAGGMPASAHGGVALEQPPSSNWRGRVTSFETPDDGVSFAMIDAGEKVELANTSALTVTVIGYENEPYLRIGPDGVYDNVRSPATYLNRSTDGSAPVPDTVDARAEPEWRRVTSGDTVSWHDHRAHWMAVEPPPIVTDDPGVERVVIDRWTIPLEVNGTRVEVVGDLTWVPAPAAWPWVVAVLVLAIGFAAAAFTSRWREAIWVGSAYHHAQAVEMAELVLGRTSDPDVGLLGRDIALTQQYPIGEMRGWLDSWALPPTSLAAPMAWMGMSMAMPGMATGEDLDALRSARPDEVDRMFLELMIRHHEGGAEMAGAASERATLPYVRDLASGIATAQAAEVANMTEMLARSGAD